MLRVHMGFVWDDSAASHVGSQFGQGAEPIVGDLLFKLALGEVHFTVKHLSRIRWRTFKQSVSFFSLRSHCVFSQVLYCASSFLSLEFPSFLKFSVLHCPRASTCLSPTCGRIAATHGRCPGEVAAIPLRSGAQLVWVCGRLRDVASLCCFDCFHFFSDVLASLKLVVKI